MDRDEVLKRMINALWGVPTEESRVRLVRRQAEAALDAPGLLDRIAELETNLSTLRAEVSASVDFIKTFMEERDKAASKLSGGSWPKAKLDDGTFRVNSHLCGTEEALRQYERFCPGVLDLAVKDTLKRIEAAVSIAPSDGEAT